MLIHAIHDTLALLSVILMPLALKRFVLLPDEEKEM